MVFKYLTTHYICEKCQKKFEFSDDKNTPGVRLSRCQHFIIKFIRNTDGSSLKYFVSLKCCNCSNKKDIKSLEISSDYNKNAKNLNYNNFSCCQNIISIGAFFSEDETETINKIVDLLEYNDLKRNSNIYERDEQKRDTIIQSNDNMNNLGKNNILLNLNNNMNGNNNRYACQEINNNGYMNIDQNEFNEFKKKLIPINMNLENILMNNNNMNNMNNNMMKNSMNNMMMMNNNNNMNNMMNINNMNNMLNNNNNNNNNMNNIMNNNMNNMMHNNNLNNCLNIMNNNNNMNNIMNNNNMNNIMNNNNMNNNIMNNNIMNNNIMNNNNMNNNNMNNNNMNNNNMDNNNLNNIMNNNNMNITMNNNNVINNNMNNNMMNNNMMNNNMMNNNMNNKFKNTMDVNNFNGKIINFTLVVFAKHYPIRERNDKLFKVVFNEFLARNPEIQKSIHRDQKYLYNGHNINLEKTLFENNIKDNSLILVPLIKTML